MSLSMEPSRGTGSHPLRAVGTLRVDVDPAIIEVKAGEPSFFTVEVANGDAVIRQIGFSVLGMDKSWVTFTPTDLTLFPEERGAVVALVTVPVGFPAGDHDVAIEVVDLADPLSPVVAHVVARVAAEHRLTSRVEPASIDTTIRGQYTATVTNTGNSRLEVDFALIDPDGLTESVFDPPMVTLIPGDEAVVRIDVKGKRPWFGAAALRILSIEANGHPAGAPREPALPIEAEPEAIAETIVESPEQPTTETAPRREPVATDLSMVTITHRARIARRSLTLLGLLLAVTTFALVFSLSFGKVAQQTKASEALLKKSLSGSAEGASSAVAPAGVSGAVLSATGSGIDGATVELYDTARGPLLPLRTTVTDQAGAFRFPGLAAGLYKVKVVAAGYGERWFPQAFAYDDGQDIEVKPGATTADLAMQLAGQPAVVSGVVLGDKVEGAKVSVRLPAGALPTTPGAPPAAGAEVRSAAVGVDGVFELIDLPAPGSYEISATAPGLSSQVRTISLQPGQRVDKVTLLLQPGIGVVTGRVLDGAGQPVSGATVTLVAGTARYQTITLSGDAATAGRFEVRELAVPVTVSLSVSAPGFLTASETVVLDIQTPRADRVLTVNSSAATLGGLVRASDGRSLGGVTVTVSGGGFVRTTASLSQGEVGRWLITDVPTPGDYTVTFSAERTVPVTQAVGLTSGATGRSDVDATVGSSVASIRGLIRELGTPPDPTTCSPTNAAITDCPGRLGGVAVTMTAASVSRKSFSAHIPTGEFQLSDLPPGPYTITFSRVGSTPYTLFVELTSGQNMTVADVYLEPQARISGRVTRGALPAANATIKVYLAAQYPQVSLATTITDALGDYSVTGLVAPETYIVEILYPSGGSIVASKEVFLRPGSVADGSQII